VYVYIVLACGIVGYGGGGGEGAERLALPPHKIFNHQNHLYYTFDIQYILGSR
jgi:hypothetical protein